MTVMHVACQACGDSVIDGRCIYDGCDTNKPRKPWPGSESLGRKGTIEGFASEYDPPTGYLWGEFRPWRAGDTFLNSAGNVETTDSDGAAATTRHILIPMPETKVPKRGSPQVIPAA